jgi:hypothetical protein
VALTFPAKIVILLKTITMKGIIGSSAANALTISHILTLPAPTSTIVEIWDKIVLHGMWDEPVKRLSSNAATAIDIYNNYGPSCKLGCGTIEEDLYDQALANFLLCNMNIKRNVIAPIKLWLILYLLIEENDAIESIRAKKNIFLMPKGRLRVEIFTVERLATGSKEKQWKCSRSGEAHAMYRHLTAEGFLQAGERVFFPYTNRPAY